MTHKLIVKDKFHPKPSGRLPIHSPDANGQLFRTTVLRRALDSYPHVTIDFTGIDLVGASFLDEAIAGLIYHDDFTEQQVRSRIDLVIPADPTKVDTAWEWVRQAGEKMRSRPIRKQPEVAAY